MQEYKLIRSRRRTVGISITETGELLVRAPMKLPVAEIERILNLKQDWIEAALNRRQGYLQKKAAFAPDYGKKVLLRGRELQIRADSGAPGYDGESIRLAPGLTEPELKAELIGLYRLAAAQLLKARVEHYKAVMGVSPSAVKVNGARTRWGSCSGRNSINFSWRLIMADDAVIDYVVVHELAHIIEHNHSPRFWAQVQAVLPDYGERRLRLKALQQRLMGEDWD